MGVIHRSKKPKARPMTYGAKGVGKFILIIFYRFLFKHFYSFIFTKIVEIRYPYPSRLNNTVKYILPSLPTRMYVSIVIKTIG